MGAIFYKQTGRSIIRDHDGQERTVKWMGSTGQTQGASFTIREYANGAVAYLVNGERVRELPDTYVTRELVRMHFGERATIHEPARAAG